jgi:O-antigen ligase
MLNCNLGLTNEPRRTLYVASAALFLTQITLHIASYYVGIRVSKWTILSSYGIYLLAFLIWARKERLSTVPSRSAVVLLFSLFMTIVICSSLVTLLTAPSNTLFRNSSYLLAFAVAPFLLGAAQDRRSLEVLMSTMFYVGTGIALVTLMPSSWTYDPAGYGRPIFLGADFLRLLLGPILSITALTGFYYSATSRTKSLSFFTLGCTMLSSMALYFNVMRGAYYLGVLLLALLPLHLLMVGRISLKRAFLFVGIAISIHLFCKNVFFLGHLVLGLATAPISPDAYYGILIQSRLGDLAWKQIIQQFSPDNLPLILGQSAIGLTSMFDAFPNDSVVIRVRLYLEAMMMFFAAPAFGMGASTFQNYSFHGPFSFPHSTLLHVAAELGLVGLLVLALLLAACFWLLLPYTLLLACYLVFVVIDQTHGSYFTSWGSYFFMGVAAAYAQAQYRTPCATDLRLLAPSLKWLKP